MMAPPCMIPKRLLRSSRATSSAVTRSGETCVILRPRNSANGGCLLAASFIQFPQPRLNSKGADVIVRALCVQICDRSAPRLRHDADIGPGRLETLGPDFFGFLVAD